MCWLLTDYITICIHVCFHHVFLQCMYVLTLFLLLMSILKAQKSRAQVYTLLASIIYKYCDNKVQEIPSLFTCGTFSSNLNIFHEYLMQWSLKFGETNCHFKGSVAIIRQPAGLIVRQRCVFFFHFQRSSKNSNKVKICGNTSKDRKL